MATQRLAKWASELSFDSLPDTVIEAAVRSSHNSIGSILGGASHPTTQRVIETFGNDFTHARCTLLGQSHLQSSLQHPRTTCQNEVQTAALINGIASHVHDYDDTHLDTVIHPAGAVVVSLLAFADLLSASQDSNISPVSGTSFITALVAGMEIGLRIGNAVSPNHYSEGWHITGTVSPVAVAAALSNLLRLSLEQTVNAIGIASTQPVGVRVHFGTDTKALHVGRAAQNGIMAVMLARGGFTAAPDSLEGRCGWVEVLGNGADTLNQQVDHLIKLSQGQTAGANELWEVEKNTFKPFPCGIVIHPTIDACIQLHNEEGLRDAGKLDNIESVHLRVHPLVLELTGKKAPKDGLEAKFSVYHGAAVGLVLGSATPAEYADDIVNDTRVIAVRARVVANVDGNMRSDEAIVTLYCRDATKVDKHIEHAVGSLDRPMSNEELKGKFLKQAGAVLGEERAEAVEAMAWRIAKLEDVSEIAEAAA